MLAARTSLRTQMPARFASELRAESRRYVMIFTKTRRHISRSNVHALRIATRRVLSILALTTSACSAAKRRRIEAALRKPFKACGRLRDLQLVKATLRADRPDQADFVCLLRYIQRRQRKQIHRLERCLLSDRLHRIENDLQALACQVSGEWDRQARRDKVAAALIHNLEQGIRFDLGSCVVDTAPESIHKTRKTLREYRFRLVLADRLGASIPAGRMRRLTCVQSAPGRINDRTTLLSTLDKFIERQPPPVALRRYRLRIEKQRDRLIKRQSPVRVAARRARSKASSRASCP